MEHGLSAFFPSSRIITIGGGKGGVGKSTVAAGIAIQLAELKKQVILVDADLGGANLHLCMGIRYPERSLSDFISGAIPDIHNVVINTPVPLVRLISGASGIYGLTNPSFSHKHNMLSGFKKLNADYIIVNVGAGSDENNIDFFSLAENGIIVVTNEPTSIENAYGFLKNSLLRKLVRLFTADQTVCGIIKNFSNPKKSGFNRIEHLIEKVRAVNPRYGKMADEIHLRYHPRLVVNMVKNADDVGVEASFKKIAKKYLNIDMVYVGYVVYDHAVEKCIKNIQPISHYRESDAYACLRAIAKNISVLETQEHNGE